MILRSNKTKHPSPENTTSFEIVPLPMETSSLIMDAPKPSDPHCPPAPSDPPETTIEPNRFRRRRPTTPSKRDPTKSTHGNTADDIDRGLAKYGHRIWGFVIYRTTYTSDTEWQTCIQKIRHHFKRPLEICKAPDLLESNPFTIFDDENQFSEASIATIRQHFNHWAATAPTAEQGTTSGAERYGASPRYILCLQVDEASLRSILDDKAELFFDSKGYVNLILGTWHPVTEEKLLEEARLCGRSGVKKFEAIEGCIQYDVGVMRVSHVELISWYKLYTQMEGVWERYYQRPPALVRY